MNRVYSAVIFVLIIMASGITFGVGPDKSITFQGGSMGTVIFDGATHINAGFTCKDCHNAELFPLMQQGGVRITMNDLYAGKYCGRCHNGEKAFLIKDNCTRCHHKAKTKLNDGEKSYPA